MPRQVRIREYVPADHDAVVELALRAWAPVFASARDVLGDELDALLHGDDWRAHQSASVSETLAAPANTSWVAEAGGEPGGFAVATVADAARRIGEIVMIAVDPSDQRRGVGRALTDHATSWLAGNGMLVAAVSTGGDAGHAPARRLYERAGYRLFPSAQYFRAL